MRVHRFRIVNVFTRGAEALSGNPLCVIEDASGLDDAAMQALALQFNLSETTFITPSSRADARVRIFTPTYEMPFAGHPTLGTAYVCRALGMGGDSLRLEMQAGLIPVAAEGDRWTLLAPAPTWRELSTPRATLAHAIGVAETDVGERPLWVKAGTEQLIVPLASAAAVARAAPTLASCGDLRSENGAGMIYVFTRLGGDRIVARFFFSQGAALLEDPATGSAAANLGGWCIATQPSLPLRFTISQGDQVRRPSSLFLDIDGERGIRVSGDVIEVAAGALTLN
jgi:PhzF family phenazine biosynthesis protein